MSAAVVERDTLPTTMQVAEFVPCSFRTLEHWRDVGYLGKEWSKTEIRVAALMSALERAGFRPEVAAEIARTRVEGDVVTFNRGAGIEVAVDWILPDTTLREAFA